MGGMGCGGDRRVREQLSRGLTRFARRQQRLTALLDHGMLRWIAVPTRAAERDPAIWGHEQCHPHVLHVRPVIRGRPVGERTGLGLGLRLLHAREGNAGGSETVAAPSTPCRPAARQGACAAHEGTARGGNRVEAPPEREAGAMVRRAACAQQEGHRFGGEQRRGQGQRALSKPPAVEQHPGHGVPGGASLVVSGHHACVAPL